MVSNSKFRLNLKKETIKLSISILFFFHFFLSIGIGQTDFAFIEEHVRNTPEAIENNVEALSAYLVAPAKNDLEKIFSIYQWLIQNIKYDHQAFKNGNKRINRSNVDILKRKEAICWGYATLFKAICEEADITCEVISGYAKTEFDALPKLESPNHAWNSVKIDGVWHLLDATWDSASLEGVNAMKQRFGHTYFLTPPKYFITNHLPADPDWQLLDCIISPEEYKLSSEAIVILAERTTCDRQNELEQFETMAIQDKRLVAAIKACAYHPTKLNRRELAHAQLDYEAYLNDTAERLQTEKAFDSLLIIQKQMIGLCETAAQLTTLFDTQKENCAYNFFNYAVTLTQTTANTSDTDLQRWQEVLIYLESAQSQLKDLPKNMFTENALSHCKDYIDYAKSNIDALK